VVGELKVGDIEGCLVGTVRWSASSSQPKSRANRFVAVDDTLRAVPVGAAVDEVEAGEIEGDSLGTAVGGLEAGRINSDTVGTAVGELKADEIRAARSVRRGRGCIRAVRDRCGDQRDRGEFVRRNVRQARSKVVLGRHSGLMYFA